jgi:tetratricopeptide (TPR) repeat protein
MAAAGLEVRLDAVGNVIGRRPGRRDTLPALMVGSHVDSVDGGGRYDGMLGVMGGIELARLLAERGELQRAAGVLEAAPVTSASAEEHALRAAILQRLGRHAEAAEGYATALRTTPNQGVWWMGLGISLAAEGRNDSAREAFSRARATGTLAPELTRYVEQRLRQLL